MAQRGAFDVDPSTLALCERVDLHDDPVDLVAEVVAVLLPVPAVPVHGVDALEHPDLGVDGKAELPEVVERVVVVLERRARLPPRPAGSTTSPAPGWP